MTRRLLLIVLFLVVPLAPGLGPAPTAAQSSPAYEIIRLVNDLRASLGLPPYQINGALMAAAQGHADWMAANRSYTHAGAGGSRPQDRAAAAGYQGYVAENIVGGTHMSPQQGLVWWQNSSIHYRTMTSTRHTEVGAGDAPSGDQNMYVLVVGQPAGYVPPSGPTAGGADQANTDDDREPVVVIPVEVSQPREDGSIVHVVQSGQTIWDIAAVYGVDMADLLRRNHLPANDPIILPGEAIVVRPPDNATALPAGPLTHTVRSG